MEVFTWWSGTFRHRNLWTFEKGNIAVYAHIMLLILSTSLIYELKQKLEWYLRVSLLGPGPSAYEKKYLPHRGLTKVEKHCTRWTVDGRVDMDCRSSSFGIVTVYSLDDQGDGVGFPKVVRDVSVVRCVKTCCGAHRAFYQNGHWRLLNLGIAAGEESWQISRMVGRVA
jgi:hypothetical protein